MAASQLMWDDQLVGVLGFFLSVPEETDIDWPADHFVIAA